MINVSGTINVGITKPQKGTRIYIKEVDQEFHKLPSWHGIIIKRRIEGGRRVKI